MQGEFDVVNFGSTQETEQIDKSLGITDYFIEKGEHKNPDIKV